MKWKCLGATTAQPRSERPHKLTERNRRVLKYVAWKKSSVVSCSTHYRVSNCLWKQRQHKHCSSRSFMKWVSMAEQPHTSLRSSYAMPSVGWSGVKLTAIGLWSSGNALSGVMNHASPSGSAMDESGFGGYQENTTCPNV